MECRFNPPRYPSGHGKFGGSFLDTVRAYREFGRETIVEQHAGITYFINEFWTKRQRAANRIHEISYRACFKPQLPRFFIKHLTDVGDRVYDPFMGRGTTLIEAALMQRVPIGNDINPLSQALVEPRLACPPLKEIAERLDVIPWEDFQSISHTELLVFYHPTVLAKIEGLRNWLIERDLSGKLDMVDKWIRMVAINRLTGHSKGFFSVYTLPPNQAVSIERQRKINQRLKQTPPVRDVKGIILQKSKSLLSHGGVQCSTFQLLSGRAEATPEIPSNSIALVVTSPPFLDVVNYEQDNWLRCWFMGIDPSRVPIAHHRSVEGWRNFVRSVLQELARVVKPGGHVAFEVGEVRAGKVLLEKEVIKAAEGLQLEPLGVIINDQTFTKTANCWGVTNNTAGTNTNRIVLFRVER
ncbi:MAG: site-specific DNA-methyltransferase [Gammaproteobacteria bacterium]|nr:MAG: site-specific DNA-methyltransferase [Gammaproteobacteria bacterium]